MEYGFVIDQERCIGCHACTVACKAENHVPLGSFRTWVKYTEKGSFPQVRRHFTVLRCNHCDEAPCIEICPTKALGKRPDAIVDLDRDLCIGCRSCMQACPYDALYQNEDAGVVEKCHFCAHRVESGLEPACVVVCPVQAIVAGDVSAPESPISRLLRQPTIQRKPEKGTKPRVWYVGALPEALVPGRAREEESYLWSDRSSADPAPAVVPGFEPTPDLLTSLDVPHKTPWGWHIWVYLFTKNVAAGAAMVAPWLGSAGMRAGFARDVLPELVGLFFLAVTGFLLVHDLGRPGRCLLILTHGNKSSWLVKGMWILTGFGGALVVSLLLRFLGAGEVAVWWRVVPALLGIFVSGYSAWLFRQCKGRELWLEPGLFWALVLRAGALGSGLALLVAGEGPAAEQVTMLFLLFLLGNAVQLWWHHFRNPRDVAARQAHTLLQRDLQALLGIALISLGGAYRLLNHGLGASFPDPLWARVVGVLFLILGILLYERAWVRAGQGVPNS